MINAINGKKTASSPQSSGLWPLLAAIDIVKYRKMTQKATMSSHQTNPIIPSFHAAELCAAFQVEGACESPESGEGPAGAVAVGCSGRWPVSPAELLTHRLAARIGPAVASESAYPKARRR